MVLGGLDLMWGSRSEQSEKPQLISDLGERSGCRSTASVLGVPAGPLQSRGEDALTREDSW